MYGVVLWSDRKRNRAVIWCEDHRNLAFFRQDSDDGGESGQFVPGDLVEFDLREENNLRLAVDPCIVAPHEFPSLAGDLKSACAGLERMETAPPRPPRPEQHDEPRVVALHPRRDGHAARKARRTERALASQSFG